MTPRIAASPATAAAVSDDATPAGAGAPGPSGEGGEPPPVSDGDYTPPLVLVPLVALTVPLAGTIRYACWRCHQERRFVSQERPSVGGVPVYCERCGALLGEYAVDARGWSLLRLAAGA